MKTANLVLTAVIFAVIPALVSMGCNKKEGDAPAPSAAAPAPPPPPVAPPPVAPEPAKPVVVARPATKSDGGAAKGDAAVSVVASDAGKVAFPTGLPTIPVIPVSALPGIASAIVSGVAGAIPTNLIPVPPAASK